MLKQLFTIVSSFCYAASISAQQPESDSSFTRDAVAQAIAVFHHAIGEQSILYNGRIHISYNPRLIGSAYFLSNDPQTGSVTYDGVFFKDVPLWYDEVHDKLVIQHFNTISAFELNSEKVSGFSIGSHPFIRIVRDNRNENNTPPSSFYEVLCPGKLTILVRRKKLVIEYIESMEVKQRIENNESFYALKGGMYFPVNNERSFTGIVKDKKSEVQQYLKKNKLKFRKNPEAALTAAAVYYNQLTH